MTAQPTPEVDRALLRRLHYFSINNFQTTGKSKLCGCFHCLKIFPATQVAEWIKEPNPAQMQTALCPSCGIDSILPDAALSIPLTSDLLSQMREVFFEKGETAVPPVQAPPPPPPRPPTKEEIAAHRKEFYKDMDETMERYAASMCNDRLRSDTALRRAAFARAGKTAPGFFVWGPLVALLAAFAAFYVWTVSMGQKLSLMPGVLGMVVVGVGTVSACFLLLGSWAWVKARVPALSFSPTLKKTPSSPKISQALGDLNAQDYTPLTAASPLYVSCAQYAQSNPMMQKIWDGWLAGGIPVRVRDAKAFLQVKELEDDFHAGFSEAEVPRFPDSTHRARP